MIDYPTQFHADARNAGIRFIRLVTGSKKCPRGTWEEHTLSTPAEIRTAFDDGFNVGFLLEGKGGLHPNSLGVWGLDIDSKAASDQYRDEPFDLMVSRGHEFKRHLLARLPDPSAVRHSRNIRKSHDVKLTGILVSPGSRHADGGVYSVFTRDPTTREWVPWNGSPIDWGSLSVVDPTPYKPCSTKLILLTDEQAAKICGDLPREWVFKESATPLGWKDRDYTIAKGDQAARGIRADFYIRNRIRYGIVSRSGEGGRATLLTTVIHLVQYLKLPEADVLKKIMFPVHNAKVAWNDCCVDGITEQPYLWTAHEVACAIAAARAYVPHYGVVEHHRLQVLAGVMERLWDFWGVLGRLPLPEDESPSMSAHAVYNAFLELYSVDDKTCSFRRFTLAFQKAMKTGVLQLKNIRGSGRKKLRHYLGVSPELIDFALELPSTGDLKVA